MSLAYLDRVKAVPRSFAFVVFDNAPFWQSQKVFLGANLAGYLIGLVTKSHHHVDLLGSGAFAAAALPALLQDAQSSTSLVIGPNSRIQASAKIVIAWSVKLASFLFYRVIQNGHDARLDTILSSPMSAAGFWVFSLAWGSLCSLPHTLGTTSSSQGNPMALRVGGAMAIAGLLVETLADYQKWMFKKKKTSGHCNVGLWSLSQHPNWFGNLLLWSGVCVMNAPALIEPWLPAATLTTKIWNCRRVGLALLSPLFLAYTFWGQATGSLLPDGHAATLKKYGYGIDKEYTRYIDSTPLILPNLLEWFRDENKN